VRDPRTPRRADAPVTTIAKAVDPEKLAIAQESARQQMDEGGTFSPGMPLTPFDGVSGMPRAWNFPTGYNLKSRADREGRLSFALLKTLTDTYDIANMCIRHRINDVRSLSWTVRSADWVESDDPGSVAKARKALKRPDGVTPFRAWLAMFLQDVLRYDAGCLYRRRNMLGEVIALDVVSGTTIAPLQDDEGRRPSSPAPAYVQYISGTPWEWLTEDDLIYVPFDPQPDSLYGQAPLESVLLTANTHMRFQQHWMNWFTEGNIPEGFATAPQEITTPEQLEKWEAYWEAMNTDDRVKHKLKMIPHGTELSFPKEKEFDPAFPMFLMRTVCAAFKVTPNDLGFTEDVNRATGDTQIDVQFRIGTLPLIRHIEDILTDYLQDDLGLPVVFEFDTGQEKEDRLATAQAQEIHIRNGVVSADEIREREYGLPTDAGRPVPRFIYTNTQGPIPLRSLLDVAGPVDPQTAAPSEDVPLDTAPFDGTPGVLPHKSPGSPQFARAPIDPDEPQRPALEHEVPGSGVVAPPAPAVKALNELDAAEVRKELAKWKSNTLTRLSRGQRPRRFESDILPPALIEKVWTRLDGITDHGSVEGAFKVAEDDAGPKAGTPDWRADPPVRTPQHDVDLRLTDYWAPRIARALRSMWTRADFVAAIARATYGRAATVRKDDTPPLDAVLAGQADTTALGRELANLHLDAFTVGLKAAQVQMGITPEGWDGWRPGMPENLAPHPGAWQTAMDDAGVTVKDITDTTMAKIGRAIEAGVSAGDSVDRIARDLFGVLGDPDRAELIAHTESARMLTKASMTTYQDMGVKQFDLLISAGACPLCISVATDNPHPLSDRASAPPLHPRCRCAAAPVAGSGPLTNPDL
jgi:hypothetical protein